MGGPGLSWGPMPTHHAGFVLSCAFLLVPAAFGQPDTVTEVWKSTCASCHGANGSGGKAASLLTEEKFLEKHDRPFFDAIRNGPAGVKDHAFGGKNSIIVVK